MRKIMFGISLGVLWSTQVTIFGQDWRDAVGRQEFLAEAGTGAPDGSGVTVIQVEADGNSNENINGYLPNGNDSQFTGINFTAQSDETLFQTAGTSGHATTVGRYFFGDSSGLATGVSTVHSYAAADYLLRLTDDDLLVPGPLAFTQGTFYVPRVHSNAWISINLDGFAASNTTFPPTGTTSLELLTDYDDSISSNGFLMVAGLNNGSGTSVPDAMATTFNALSVGLIDGGHSRNGTTRTDYVPGRLKPEIVCLGTSTVAASQNPGSTATSWATGQVSSVAAVLYQVAQETPAFLNAFDRSEVMKAILMAGAKKSGVPSWERSSTQPIDEIYGAGLINLHRSYVILTGGEQSPGTVTGSGWDFHSIGGAIPADKTRSYTFTIPAGDYARRLSILLNWHHSGNSLPLDLKLSLVDVSTNTEIDLSDSPRDNIEHVFFRNLLPGTYRLDVQSPSSSSASTDYALAWDFDLANAPADTLSGKVRVQPSSGSAQFVIARDLLFAVTYKIQRSFAIDPGTWSTLTTFVPEKTGDFTWEDTDSILAGQNAVFYRLEWQKP